MSSGFLKFFQGFLVVATAAQHSDNIQEDIDEIEVKIQCADNGRFVQHGCIPAEVGVVIFQHLGVIRRQAHENQQTDGAEQQVRNAEVQAEHTQQTAHQCADDQRDQAAHQFGTPAGQVAVGDIAVHSHDAEVDRTDEERQDQRAVVVHQEDGAEVDAVEHRITEEKCRRRGGLQFLHPGGQDKHHDQLCDGGKDEQAGVDNRENQSGRNRANADAERDKQACKHPAEALGHKLGKRTKGAFRIRNI